MKKIYTKLQKKLNKLNPLKNKLRQITPPIKLLWFQLAVAMRFARNYCKFSANLTTRFSPPSADPTASRVVRFKQKSRQRGAKVIPDYRLFFFIPHLNSLKIVEDLFVVTFLNVIDHRFIGPPIIIEFFCKNRRVFKYSVKKIGHLHNDLYTAYIAAYKALFTKYKLSKHGHLHNVSVFFSFSGLSAAVHAYKTKALIPHSVPEHVTPLLMFRVANWGRLLNFTPFRRHCLP